MAVAASGWDMTACVVLPPEQGTPPAGGTLFPGGAYTLKLDDTGRAVGDEFDGADLDRSIWNVYNNLKTDSGRGYKSAANAVLADSVLELRVTQDAPGAHIVTAGIESSAGEHNYGDAWYQDPGDLVVWATRRLDGTEDGLKQIYLNWPIDGTWPPENDGSEFFPRDPSRVQKTTHDASAGRSNHQRVAIIADPCGDAWVRWHRWAMLNIGPDCYYWTDHGDGRGFVLDAHHVVPVGFEIGRMRWAGIGHHNIGGQRGLAKPLYRFQCDFACVMQRAQPAITAVAWDRSPLALTPPQPAKLVVSAHYRTPLDSVVLVDDSGAVEPVTDDALGVDGSGDIAFQLGGTVAGSLVAHLGGSTQTVAVGYDPASTYNTDDVVTVNGRVYACLNDATVGHQPSARLSLGDQGPFWHRIL